MRFVFCFLLFLTNSSFSQVPGDPLLIDYRDWLASTKLDVLLKADSVMTAGDKKILILNTKDQYNWNLLVKKVDSQFHQLLPQLLLKRFLFQYDLLPEAGQVNIDSKDAIIKIYWEDKQIKHELWKKMGEPSDNATIDLRKLKNLHSTKPLASRKNIEQIKTLLETKLQEYFKRFEAKFESYRFDIIYDIDNTMILEISNIVNAVLDEGYFEHLRLTFEFAPSEASTKIMFDAQGKYGAGLIWAPQSSRYRNMIPKYESHFDTFILRLTSRISKFVK